MKRSNCLLAAVIAWARSPRAVRIGRLGSLDWRAQSCPHFYWTHGGRRYHYRADADTPFPWGILLFRGRVCELPERVQT